MGLLVKCCVLIMLTGIKGEKVELAMKQKELPRGRLHVADKA